MTNPNFSPLDSSSELMSGEPVKATDLDFYILLRRQSSSSKLFFNQRRALLFDAGAMGNLRQQLVSTVGQNVAMGIFMRTGYAQGYQDAEILGDMFNWETDADWLLAGLTLHMLEGIAHVESQTLEFERDTGEFYMSGIWRNAFEAETYLDRNGPGDACVCWMLTGYASGYASRFFGQELLAIESECAGKGSPHCFWEIKPVKAWGAVANPYVQALRQAQPYNPEAGPNPAEKALQESHALYQSSLDGMPQNVYRIDREGHIIFGNKTYLSTLGMSLEECLGKTAYDFFPKEQADKYTADDNRVMETQEPLDIVESHKVPSTGKMTYVHTMKVPVHNAARQVVGLQGIFWDVTDRVQTEQLLTKRAIELETVSKVSAATSTILDVQELLQTVCDLTKENFGLYHAHIYLLNESGKQLDLAAGAGDVGRKMVNRGWSIPLDKADSLVARVAGVRQGIIANNVRQTPDWASNPLLPDTRAELSVPLLIGDRLLGVFDVQADTADYFSDEDINIQTTLAAQVAVALQNANLFEQSRQVANRLLALNELGTVLGQAATIKDALDAVSARIAEIVEAERFSVALLNKTGDSFDLVLLDGETGAVTVNRDQPLASTTVESAIRSNRVVVVPDTTQSKFSNSKEMAEQMGIYTTVSAPLFVGGKVTGTLDAGNKKVNAFSEEEQRLFVQVASLLASTLESRRLIQEAQTRAHREQALRQVTARIRGSANVDTVMRTAALEVGKALGRQAFVYLGQDKNGKDTQPSAVEKEAHND